MDKILKILRNKKKAIFISPHLDDAFLSCGGLIAELVKIIKIEVVTVFTAISEKPETKFTRNFVLSCGYKDAKKLFIDRKREDKSLFERLNIKYFHLDFVDAAWRKKQKESIFIKLLKKNFPESIHVYPTEKDLFSAVISKVDDQTFIKVKEKLTSMISETKKNIIFCPLGIGKHIDHIMVRDICKDVFSNVIYWSDFPYVFNNSIDAEFLRNQCLKSFVWKKNLMEKKQLIRQYRTQFKSLFPTGIIPVIPEIYYFNKEVFENF